MTMAKKQETLSNPVAARAIAINGKHFAQGEDIKDVPQEEIDSCVRLGCVVDANSVEGEAAILEGEQIAKAAADAAAPAKKG
jgi:hypothetical protein